MSYRVGTGLRRAPARRGAPARARRRHARARSRPRRALRRGHRLPRADRRPARGLRARRHRRSLPSGRSALRGRREHRAADARLAARRRAGYELVNCDAVLVAQAPRIAPAPRRDARAHRPRARLQVDQVSVRATGTDGLGFMGRQEGMACQTVVLLRAHPLDEQHAALDRQLAVDPDARVGHDAVDVDRRLVVAAVAALVVAEGDVGGAEHLLVRDDLARQARLVVRADAELGDDVGAAPASSITGARDRPRSRRRRRRCGPRGTSARIGLLEDAEPLDRDRAVDHADALGAGAHGRDVDLASRQVAERAPGCRCGRRRSATSGPRGRTCSRCRRAS